MKNEKVIANLKAIRAYLHMTECADRDMYGALDIAIDDVECVGSSAFRDGYAKGRADAINNLPKCKDCLHWRSSPIRPNYCDVFSWVSGSDDYCSFVEILEVEE